MLLKGVGRDEVLLPFRLCEEFYPEAISFFFCLKLLWPFDLSSLLNARDSLRLVEETVSLCADTMQVAAGFVIDIGF
jgi:hypothetical protein